MLRHPITRYGMSCLSKNPFYLFFKNCWQTSQHIFSSSYSLIIYWLTSVYAVKRQVLQRNTGEKLFTHFTLRGIETLDCLEKDMLSSIITNCSNISKTKNEVFSSLDMIHNQIVAWRRHGLS